MKRVPRGRFPVGRDLQRQPGCTRRRRADGTAPGGSRSGRPARRLPRASLHWSGRRESRIDSGPSLRGAGCRPRRGAAGRAPRRRCRSPGRPGPGGLLPAGSRCASRGRASRRRAPEPGGRRGCPRRGELSQNRTQTVFDLEPAFDVGSEERPAEPADRLLYLVGQRERLAIRSAVTPDRQELPDQARRGARGPLDLVDLVPRDRVREE